jgi:hypothetical protein
MRPSATAHDDHAGTCHHQQQRVLKMTSDDNITFDATDESPLETVNEKVRLASAAYTAAEKNLADAKRQKPTQISSIPPLRANLGSPIRAPTAKVSTNQVPPKIA